MTVCIFYANIETLRWDGLEKYLSLLSKNEIEKIQFLKFDEDRCLALVGKLLLLHALTKKYSWEIRALPLILYGPYGKPYIYGANLDFNISHSGNIAICAITSNGKVGIDIEKKSNQIIISDFKDMFTKKEFDVIKNNEDPIDEFYHFWTLKESIMKADGRGFNINPHDIIVNKNESIIEGRKWFMHTLNILELYSVNLASSRLISIINIEKVDNIFFDIL